MENKMMSVRAKERGEGTSLGKRPHAYHRKKNSGFAGKIYEKNMQIQVFTLPITPDASQLEELNHFLRSHKIIDIRKELATINDNNVWSFCITYMQGSFTATPITNTKNVKVDYKEVLDEETFKVFSSLRKARKLIADEEAIPAYAIFTDAELAEIAKLSEISASSLQSIPGIGKKKVEK